MGNKNGPQIVQIDDDEWEIIAEHPIELVQQKPTKTSRGLFTVTPEMIGHAATQAENQQSAQTPQQMKNSKKKTIKVSPKIQELQNRLGGSTLLSLVPNVTKRSKAHLYEPPEILDSIMDLKNRPVLPKRKQRQLATIDELDLS